MDDLNQRPARPVMDFTPRRPIQPSVRSAAPVARPVEAPQPAPVPEPAPLIVENPAPVVTADSQPEREEQTEQQVFKPQAQKVGAPVAAIIVSIIVSAGLIALTIFAYSKHSQKAATTTNPSSLKETTDSQDVQGDSEAIDKAVNGLDDATDFNEADLSDQALGL